MTNDKVSRYTKLNPIDHMLKRSEMYTGSVITKKMTCWVFEKDTIKYKEILNNPGLVRIFIEIISNVIDNYYRSLDGETPMKKIKVHINEETGETSVWNDGNIIPIEVDEKENIYNHTLIFGHLLSGSNFDDTKDRYTSGKNGIGSNCTNVFSTEFKVVGVDHINNKKLTQVWKNNMKETKGAKVRDNKAKLGFTEITWTPDFKRFGMEKYSSDIISLYKKIIYDMSMLTDGVKVYYNNDLIKIKKYIDYAKCFEGFDMKQSIQLSSKDSDVIFTISNTNEFEHISFVNGIYTKYGGVHVEDWSNSIFKLLLGKINKKDKVQINKSDLKKFFRIFVKSKVNKPVFDGQTKDKLESPSINVNVSNKDINKILKWDVLNSIKDIIKSKELLSLKKTERKKRGYVKIDGMDQANLAGTKHSKDCTLILCEGLSAKTYAVCGLSVGIEDKKGRDYYGIMSLTGKILNTRNANIGSISKNKEVSNLIKALALEYNVDYRKDENFKKLRYGQIALLADADVDGLHIEGLVLNLFHSLFPTLLQREKPFIISLKTPIVRIFKKKGKDVLFYDEDRFVNMKEDKSKLNIKYYKGLGTTKAEDVPETFGKKIVKYIGDDSVDSSMDKVFNKNFTNERKQWITEYKSDDKKYSLDDFGPKTNVNITDFLDGELIKFSINDCKRSIPSLLDGLKTSQRKVLYCVKKRNLSYSGKSLKVAQLGGYVAENSNYHHGEQNLYETITKMAQSFVGSNNIPLLYRDGQMGSRLQFGKDAASARYIYTKMDVFTEKIFPKEDDVLLERVVDDGDVVEPVFYIPIIPMILVNGVNAGIGTGFSCNIPSYNPLDLVLCIKKWLENNSIYNTEGKLLLPEIKPWYNKFKGNIEKVKEDKYITTGIVEEHKKKNSYVISEIPINISIDKFKEKLEDLCENKKLKNVLNYSKQNEVKFVITTTDDFECNIDNLKLNSSLSTSNMVLFDSENNIKKYSNIYDIIDDYCNIRLKFYAIRKAHIIKQLKTELKYLTNTKRFIEEVINNTLNLMNNDESNVINELVEKNYDKKEGDYEYLLKLQVRTFTSNKIDSLTDKITTKENILKEYEKTNEKEMWLNELEEFEKFYNKNYKQL